MGILRRLASRLASLWRNVLHRQAVDDDLDDEVQTAVDLLVDEYIQAGMAPADARRAATLELGRVASIKTQVREARSGAGLETVWHDVTFGARLLGAFAVLSLFLASVGLYGVLGYPLVALRHE